MLPPAMRHYSPTMRAVRVSTSTLLTAGVLAGPLFTLSWLIAGPTRGDGYSWLRHPISSLSIGSQGWTQTTTFLVVGTLFLGFAIGLVRVARAHGDTVRGGRIVLLMAVGLIGAGLFPTDPYSGYPDGLHTLRIDRSVPGTLHDAFSALLFIGFPFAAYTFGRIFVRRRLAAWAVHTFASAIAFIGCLVLTSLAFSQVEGLVEYGGLFQRITLTVMWTWTTLVAIQFLRTGDADYDEDGTP